MSSVTTMLNQLKWQKLEHHRDNSCLCLLFKIIQHQVHFPTNDIPAPAPITMTRQSHERNFLVPYVRTDVYKYSFFPNVILYGINYLKQLKRFNHWILLNLEYNYILANH